MPGRTCRLRRHGHKAVLVLRHFTVAVARLRKPPSQQKWALFRLLPLRSTCLMCTCILVMEVDKRREAVEGERVIPGDYLGSTAQFSQGPGTYEKGSGIYSELVGVVKVEEAAKNGDRAQPVMSVQGKYSLGTIPSVGSVVITRVLNISERQAKVSIISVDNRLLQEPLGGVIRREDVRAVEKDSVDMFASFRPGDIVRARVISLGESHSHYGLSTDRNELGVIMATSERGYPMGPVSWTEMQCSKTGTRETRKVAKVKNAVPLHS